MAISPRIFCFSLVLLALSPAARLNAAPPEHKPELFQSTKLIYADSFDGTLNPDFWEVRQSSTWVIKDGVLTGSQSSKEFQEKMIAKGDKWEGQKLAKKVLRATNLKPMIKGIAADGMPTFQVPT